MNERWKKDRGVTWETLAPPQHPEHKPLASPELPQVQPDTQAAMGTAAKAAGNAAPRKGWAILLGKNIFIRTGSITKNMAQEIYYLAGAPRVSRGRSYFKQGVTNTAGTHSEALLTNEASLGGILVFQRQQMHCVLTRLASELQHTQKSHKTHSKVQIIY